MRDSIKLSIPQPCGERWENFSVTSHGGFCSSCSRTVVDFTKMSDEEITAYFTGNTSHTCGRFRNDQLKTYVLHKHASVRPGFTLLRAGLLGLLLLLGGQYAIAQTGSKVPAATEQRFQAGTNPAVNDGLIIKGVVRDPDGNVAPGINIVHKGTADGTVTDAKGYFEFPKKLRAGDVLIFSFIGYATVEQIVAPSDNTLAVAMNLDVKMIEDTIVMGAVSNDTPYQQPRGIRKMWQGIRQIF